MIFHKNNEIKRVHKSYILILDEMIKLWDELVKKNMNSIKNATQIESHFGLCI